MMSVSQIAESSWLTCNFHKVTALADLVGAPTSTTLPHGPNVSWFHMVFWKIGQIYGLCGQWWICPDYLLSTISHTANLQIKTSWDCARINAHVITGRIASHLLTIGLTQYLIPLLCISFHISGQNQTTLRQYAVNSQICLWVFSEVVIKQCCVFKFLDRLLFTPSIILISTTYAF